MKQFLFISIFLYSSAIMFSNDIYFSQLDSSDGVTQINIMSIYQDEFGAMWFGSEEGLCRYNGNGTQLFNASSNNNLTQNIIYAIQGNKKGTLYLKADYDLIKYNIATEQFELIREFDVKAIYYHNGILWFATDYTIYQYVEDTGKIEEYRDFGSSESKITQLYVDDNKLWVGATDHLIILDLLSNKTRHVMPIDGRVSVIYADSDRDVWLGTLNNGLYHLDENGKVLSYFQQERNKNSISNNSIRTVIEDDLGKMWVGTFYGLNSYDKKTKKWRNNIYNNAESNSISHSSVFSLHKDQQGTIWVGTYFGGVNYFNPRIAAFRIYNANSSTKNHLSFPFVGKMIEDQHQNLWICTEGGGLNSLDLNTRKITHYLHNDPEATKVRNMKCIWYNKDAELLYIGTHNGGLCIFDLRTKKMRTLVHNSNDIESLPDNAIRGMQYYDNKLILLTAIGLCEMNIRTEKFKRIDEEYNSVKYRALGFISAFHIDTKNRLWTAQSRELKLTNLETGVQKRYSYKTNDSTSVGRFATVTMLETKAGEMYFGTLGSGLLKYKPEIDGFENYTVLKNGLTSDFCYHISETPSGNIILLNSNGVSIIDTKGQNHTTLQPSPNFLLRGFFLGSSTYVSSNNEIFIGGINGLASIDESKLHNKAIDDYGLYFDKLQINNESIYPLDGTGILNEILSASNRIELNSNQNNITIEIASSDYLQNALQRCMYKLDGFDQTWNKTLSNHITYTNIHPGKYILYLKEINEGAEKVDVNSKICQLEIIVHPPFYATTYAYIIYFVLFLLLFTGIIRFFLWRSRLSASLEMERNKKEQNEKLNQTKIQFFTNVSHELRTPLTLIIGQAETVLKDKKIDANSYNKISQIFKNASHMRNLISELLDFRKHEKGFYKLKVEEINIVDYFNDIYESFKEYAKDRDINFTYYYSHDEIFAYIDPAQFHKSIYNLLSNAFKYTPVGKEISINLDKLNDTLRIRVEDNGIGIPAESLSKIFDRFYQVEYRSSGFSLGTGIGLALTKEIVESHKGTISVGSRLDEGSVFEINIPLGKAHFSDEELVEKQVGIQKYTIGEEPLAQALDVDNSWLAENPEDEEPNNNARYVILIVEDNEELLNLLVEIFAKKYEVHTATDGRIGLNKTLDIHPDIVLSDVVMPEISGKEMCYKIKSNINISHIPVILLTSQTSISQTVEGYMYGADAYINKPFNTEILLSRCNSIVKNRRLLFQVIAQEETSVVNFDTLKQHEHELIDRTTQIIKANFDNPNFDMNILASELGFGRGKLYSTIKDITGLTPNEFTLNLKLREATYLLEKSVHLNITDISTQLGFSSPKYFTKCFRTFYGIAPLLWRKDRNESEKDKKL